MCSYRCHVQQPNVEKSHRLKHNSLSFSPAYRLVFLFLKKNYYLFAYKFKRMEYCEFFQVDELKQKTIDLVDDFIQCYG